MIMDENETMSDHYRIRNSAHYLRKHQKLILAAIEYKVLLYATYF